MKFQACKPNWIVVYYTLAFAHRFLQITAKLKSSHNCVNYALVNDMSFYYACITCSFFIISCQINKVWEIFYLRIFT